MTYLANNSGILRVVNLRGEEMSYKCKSSGTEVASPHTEMPCCLSKEM